MSIWILRCALSLAVLAWVVGFSKIVRNRRTRRWVVGPGELSLASDVLVSVVIPARNEEGNIGRCIRGVLAQTHKNIELIILDDASTDGTKSEIEAAVGGDSRVSVIYGGEEPPEGWFGKPWALKRAQSHASGEWLVFVDADVRLEPEAVSSVVAYGVDNGRDMVSGIGRLVMESFWEQVMQPAVAGLILAGNDLDHVNDPERPKSVMANGQFIAVRRSAYDKIGGHEAVAKNVLDDVGLAKAMVAADGKYSFLVLRELFSCRMYTSFSEIWTGWSKNLFAGMNYSWGTLIAVEIWLFIQVLAGPTLLLMSLFGEISLELTIWGAVLVLLMQIVRFEMDRIWGLKKVYGLTHAAANIILMGLMFNSAISQRTGVKWKGRVVR